MQNYKKEFIGRTKERICTVQSCVRTNDIDLWGDGSHLCFFRMIGCFSFGNSEDYQKTCISWLSIIEELGIEISSVHVHPNSNHRSIFTGQGDFEIIDDLDCVWTDGSVSGFCSEFFVGDLEIGNLVNPLGDSVDVGFGLERICKLLGEKYEQRYDIEQFLNQCFRNDVYPGNKGREYTVRKVIRLWIRTFGTETSNLEFSSWIISESDKLKKTLQRGRKLLRKHSDKPAEWWWDTVGISSDELLLIKTEKNK